MKTSSSPGSALVAYLLDRFHKPASQGQQSLNIKTRSIYISHIEAL